MKQFRCSILDVGRETKVSAQFEEEQHRLTSLEATASLVRYSVSYKNVIL